MTMVLSNEDCARIGRLFWDRPLAPTLAAEYPRWVMKRVLEYGTLDDVFLLRDRLGRDAFLHAVAGITFECPKTATFWRQILTEEDIACQPTPSFRREAQTFWNA